MKDRVLITGASGFVGYHLIVEALKNNLEVFAAIRRSSKIEHLKNFDINYTYPDFDNPAALQAEIEEKHYAYIIHAAGSLRALTTAEYEHVNATYTFNLATAAAAAGCVKKMVFISSLAAVGPRSGYDGIITESTAPAPITAYGKSKLLAEAKLLSVKNLDYTILRPTAVYGPRDKDIFIFLKQVAKGIEPYIGRIDQKLTFIYVTDLAKAAVLALTKGKKKAYILADGHYYDRYKLADITKVIFDKKTFKFHIPVIIVKTIAIIAEKVSYLSKKAPVINPEKLDELKAVNWSCDISPANADLDFTPLYNLEDGLTESFDWYRKNNWL